MYSVVKYVRVWDAMEGDGMIWYAIGCLIAPPLGLGEVLPDETRLRVLRQQYDLPSQRVDDLLGRSGQEWSDGKKGDGGGVTGWGARGTGRGAWGMGQGAWGVLGQHDDLPHQRVDDLA